MGFLETILGFIIVVVISGVFFLYLLSHFLNFALRGLKLMGVFVVLAIVAFIIDFFGLFFSSDKGQVTKKQLSEYAQFDETSSSSAQENTFDQMLYNFLLAYEANDTATVALYMADNSTITKQHLDYMVYQQKKGIVLDLIDYEVTEVISLNNDSFQVMTMEHFAVNHPENGIQDVYQNVRYTIKMLNGEPIIYGLELLKN